MYSKAICENFPCTVPRSQRNVLDIDNNDFKTQEVLQLPIQCMMPIAKEPAGR